MSTPIFVYVALRGEPDGAILGVSLSEKHAQSLADKDAATTREIGGHYVQRHPLVGGWSDDNA